MDWDHLAEEQSQRLFASWLRILSKASPALPLRLAQKHRPEAEAREASSPVTGSFNICTIVTFDDGFKAIVRFPILGRSRFRVEKTNDELLVMQYLTPRTSIPIPKILGAGAWDCGTYIVSTFVEGTLLSKCLPHPTGQSSGLSPYVSSSELSRAYRAMADIMLELHRLPFPRIGAIANISGQWKVGKRPLTLNMNELVRVGNYPPGDFTQSSFQTASEYFQELARQQYLHLQYQRNDAITDKHDCRKMYIARCLFRKIAKHIPTKKGPFRLYCDDFRPANVIVSSDFTVKAVIDWEFTYIAPVEFSHAAPWWLLFESPEAWESDLSQFLHRYRPRLELFLTEMKACEDERIRSGILEESERLSEPMARSMTNGMFWLCLAARKSFMFDDIYWAFLDEKFFGPLGTLEDRLSLLSDEERNGLDGFVELKMQQKSECSLDEHLTLDEIMDL
ncbi:hypothetical protein G6O67_003509 [Ophiocordyceps sinensis]|uniref:Aminoglycoside phosphotransferase domain-containing protein n=1 Tax=Ophiocordyceps sinensis TaxID=72228 RepID=A0A8H4PWH2_9HYPO|nr:hypothetical protein G6O67_003509 [Ophiocordyceps sinensis]